MKKIKFTIFLLFIWSRAFADFIPFDLEQRISTLPLNKNSYSIEVRPVGSPTSLVNWRTHTKRVPASVIKVLTTYSALLSLGYDYRWETKFYHTGKISKGTLKGDFIVKASGDPSLESEDLNDIIDQLRSLGIRRITGNIVIDRTLFKVSSRNNSGFDKNRYSPYNAMPDAMMFNERTSSVCVSFKGRKAKISKKSPDMSYKVVNKLRLVNGSCRGKRAWPRVTVSKKSMIFSGKVSRRCGNRTICKVLTKPHLSFYYALKDKMKKNGVKFRGKLKLRRTPKNSKYLYSHYSKRLEEIISTVAKKSNNLYARQIMLTLGAKVYGKPATLTKGRNAIERILNRYGILEKGKTFIENGSGLSRISKITAHSLSNLLNHAMQHYGQRWAETLSIAGIDGTIKRRFSQSSVFGRAWMKTGTIKNVANISGYVDGASGQRYVVVVLVNNKFSAKYGRTLANKVIEWVVETQ